MLAAPCPPPSTQVGGGVSLQCLSRMGGRWGRGGVQRGGWGGPARVSLSIPGGWGGHWVPPVTAPLQGCRLLATRGSAGKGLALKCLHFASACCLLPGQREPRGQWGSPRVPRGAAGSALLACCQVSAMLCCGGGGLSFPPGLGEREDGTGAGQRCCHPPALQTPYAAGGAVVSEWQGWQPRGGRG